MTAIPASNPMETRPAGPIQLLSKANLRKYDTPISTAEMPIRFNQCEPMRDSRSLPDVAATNRGAGIGGLATAGNGNTGNAFTTGWGGGGGAGDG